MNYASDIAFNLSVVYLDRLQSLENIFFCVTNYGIRVACLSSVTLETSENQKMWKSVGEEMLVWWLIFIIKLNKNVSD